MAAETVHVEHRDYEEITAKLSLSRDQQLFPSVEALNRIYSNEKARHDLEWSPRYAMREGLSMTYAWWLEQGLDQEVWDFSHEDRALALIASRTWR